MNKRRTFRWLTYPSFKLSAALSTITAQFRFKRKTVRNLTQ